MGKTKISVLHVAFRLRARPSEVQITAGARNLSLLPNVQTGSGAIQSSAECVCGFFFPGNKAAGA